MNFFKTFLPIALMTLLATSSDHLWHVVETGKPELCKILLEAGADVNETNRFGMTPLMISIYYGKKESFDLILKHEKVNVNATDMNGATALHYAASNGNEKMCGALLQNGANVNAKIKKVTPLMEALFHGNNECAKMILRKYPKEEINLDYLQIFYPNHPIDAALLLATTANSELLHAVLVGNAQLCRTLLNEGANVNETDEYGNTPLILSIRSNEKECFQSISRHGNVDVNAADKHGSTALHYAASNGNERMCHDLLQRGANVNETDEYGNTPVMNALYNGNDGCGKMILSKNPELQFARANEIEKAVETLAWKEQNKSLRVHKARKKIEAAVEKIKL